MRHLRNAALPLFVLMGCAGASGGAEAGNSQGTATQPARAQAASGLPFSVQPVGQFDQPWAMTFVGADAALITEKPGRLWLWNPRNGGRIAVTGVPQVDAGRQGGLGDVVPHPDFRSNNLIYLSWVEAGEGDTRGAVVGRAQLVRNGTAAELRNLQIIWRQLPKVEGRGHFGHRLAFSPDGRHLFISNGEREKFTPAQDPAQHLGSIVRLTADGQTPRDNPWARQSPVQDQLWSKGHRNPLGLAFDAQGRLWNNEMGPRGGDEMNLIERGANYGYPLVSNGDHYDGRAIPDHDSRPDLNGPEITWTPVISPSSMIFYTGRQFPGWRGNALIGALSGQALVRVAVNGNQAREVERYPMGARIREVEQAPDGAVYVLEDTREGRGGRLLRLTPIR